MTLLQQEKLTDDKTVTFTLSSAATIIIAVALSTFTVAGFYFSTKHMMIAMERLDSRITKTTNRNTESIKENAKAIKENDDNHDDHVVDFHTTK